MQGIKEKLGFHATALSLRSRRNEILASNIANAATPNFKARDLDFDTELKKANNIGFISTSNEKHLSNVQRRIGKDTLYRDPLNPSLDGNTVELAVEQMEFSENVMRYQTTLSFLTSKIKGIRSAIKGESS